MPGQYRSSSISRERNRIHARRTRQRKKEQMQNLRGQADCLKEEQMQLRQVINEKNTASILVGLFASSAESDDACEDPRVEELLRRPAEEIPDSSKIPELPALILPGQHASKKIKALSADEARQEMLNDGIDYELLGKDRSKCSKEELDKIRRERNRMHAKRTRDRKRLFMEEMNEVCRKLEEENELLRDHLRKIDPDYVFEPMTSRLADEQDHEEEDASTGPTLSPTDVQSAASDVDVSSQPASCPSKKITSGGSVTFDQLRTLLAVAGSFEDTKKGSRKRTLSELNCVSEESTTATATDDGSADAPMDSSGSRCSDGDAPDLTSSSIEGRNKANLPCRPVEAV